MYISFSGGKDSTVLLDIVRQDYSDAKAMFVDVPTQYPELRDFVKTFDNVDIIKPRINYIEVCKKYGFPLISKEIAHKMSDWESAHKNGRESYVDRQFDGTYKSKHGKKNKIDIQKWGFLREAPFSISHMCCNVMKKNPAHKYYKSTGRVPITAQMASESKLRTHNWLHHSCNGFDLPIPMSNPMSFWTEQDVLLYIKSNNLPICSVYGDVISDDEEWGQMDMQQWTGLDLFEIGNKPLHCTKCDRTGCVLCGFGAHLGDDKRYLRLKETHPGLYGLLDVCENNGYTMRQAIEWVNEHGNLNIKL